MRVRSPAVLGVLLVLMVVAGVVAVALFAAPVPKKVPDEQAIVGRWKLVDVQLGADGEKPRDDDTDWKTAEYEFRADGTYTQREKGRPPAEGIYKLDSVATPKGLEVGPKGSETLRPCAYDLDGDTLKLCVPLKAEGGRPKELKADAKATHLWVFERVRE